MLDDDLRGRALAHVFWSELEKIAQNADSTSVEENKNLTELKDGENELERETIEEDEKDSIVGTSFIQKEKDKTRVRGVPVIRDRSQEGLRFDPSTQAYIPDFNQKVEEAKGLGLQEGKTMGMQVGFKQGTLIEKKKELLKMKKLELLQAKKQQLFNLQSGGQAQQAQPPQTTMR